VSDRRIALLLLLVALAATALLALALPDLRLTAGAPLPALSDGAFRLPGAGGAAAQAVPAGRAALGLLAGGAGLLLLLAVAGALRGARLRGILALLLRGLLALGLVAGALLLAGVLIRPGAPPATDLAPPPPPPPVRAPLGPPPSPLIWLAAAGLVLASAAIAGWMLRAHHPAPAPRLGRIGLEAERARAALAAGEDARGVILGCYARMTAALAEERGISREAAVTAREFGAQLGALGFPPGPVRELTALFEAIRYGRRAPTPAEEARAVACLAPIVAHCRGGGSEVDA
jgi:hypothetical protein